MYSINDTALNVSEYLLQIKAIVLQPANPFTWASGIKSPIYCDNRKILSYPIVRTFIRQEMVKALEENYGTPDVIAGVATGGIAIGALVAQELGLPFVYIRSKPKGHGLSNQIEGVIEKGQSVIVIEDLISTGKSSLQAVDVLRDKGCSIKGMIAIFSYGLDVAEKNFKKAICPLVTLSSYDAMLQKAVDSNYVSHGDLKTLKAWKTDPENWAK
ncbi:MAG: orotate phosphoribosyltransferase [Crocinitomicaceae bacterium]|nr:orotate phosphoribosyltransferase [Crocinitomicaceae bacterium]|tara:strand:+ start:331 stop:972 length:642 start_codon:yes stop_codon:yes gene_type:complete